MNDLTIQELADIKAAFECLENRQGLSESQGSLYADAVRIHDEKVDLASMDFDECEGGACKL
jgi:hypothetical protein